MSTLYEHHPEDAFGVELCPQCLELFSTDDGYIVTDDGEICSQECYLAYKLEGDE